jgi:hypothetical protein
MRHAAPCLVAGIGFGFILGWARLTDPDAIHAMLRLREPYVFLIMGSAIATGALGVRLLRRFGARTLFTAEPVTWKTLRADRRQVVGSALFGLGWSIACTCPGPAAAMIGRGQWSGLLAVAGLLAGIAVHDAIRGRAEVRSPARPAREPAPDTAGVRL